MIALNYMPGGRRSGDFMAEKNGRVVLNDKHYKTIIELAPDIIFTLSKEGILLSLSPSFGKITGFNSADWEKKHFSGLIHKDDISFAKKIFTKTLKGTSPLPYELRILSKYGGYIWGEFHSTPIFENSKIEGMICIVRDVTERKVMDEKIKRSRDELRVILKNVADGITVQDSTGKLIYANDAAAATSGYQSIEEMLENSDMWKKRFEITTESGDPFPVRKLPVRRALDGEVDAQEIIHFKDLNTGEERWSLMKARPIFDEFGRAKAVVNIFNDITQTKELERKKDDFISIASHELKTPVTSIKAFVQMLMKQFEEKDISTFYFLTKINFQLDKLTELVEDLLNMSRLQSGKLIYRKEIFNFSNFVKDLINDLQKTTDCHKIVLKNGVHDKIKADRERISQVLINLVTNAVKYSPSGKDIEIDLSRENNNIQVAVRDFGIGIDTSEKNKIFDRFYRVNDEVSKTFPGLGVGLYISKEIIQKHKGKIWFESKKGSGSTFYFKLPIYQHD